MSAILLAAGCLLLLVAVHPFLTYPLSLLAIRAVKGRRNEARSSATTPPMTICVCAYNEAAVIGQTLEALTVIKAAMPDLQILVYVDAASDRTAEIARSFAPAVEVVASTERRGKTHGMNVLATRARGDVIVFTDATVRIRHDALAAIGRRFADPAIGCVCGVLVYDSPSSTATAETGAFYWRLEEWIKGLEADTGSMMGADGSIYAVRRDYFRPVPPDMIDDLYISLDILCRGYRIVREPRALAFEDSVPNRADEFRRKVRISCQGFAAHLRLWPRIRRLGLLERYKYISHKLLRWLTVVPLVLAAVLLSAGLIAAFGPPALAVLAGPVLLFGILLALRFKPAWMVFEILAAFVASGIGVWKALAGTVIRTWEPAQSIRKVGAQQ